MVTRDLHRFIAQLEADSSLFEPDRLRERLAVLDKLDAYFGEADSQAFTAEPIHSLIYERASELRSRLEFANSAVYHSIRSQVQAGAQPDRLLRWIEICREHTGSRLPGLAYDYLDELISGILQLREPNNTMVHPGPERVFYQPTPVRHILHLIEMSALSETDVLVDLGSGLGHVPILASILTGASSIGIEVDAAYVATARECAHSLGLNQVTFVQQDAMEADLSTGTVFYMYTPFTGAPLRTVLSRLRKENSSRTICVCTLGPCALAVAMEPWLRASTIPDTEHVTCFRSSD